MTSASLPAYPIVAGTLLLACSNLFMTVTWYGHLKTLNTKPSWMAALVSWGIALFEYTLHTQLVADGQRDLLAGSAS